MYPVKQGYIDDVDNRLNALINNSHHSEALLASVFVMEKTIRRALRFLRAQQRLYIKAT